MLKTDGIVWETASDVLKGLETWSWKLINQIGMVQNVLSIPWGGTVNSSGKLRNITDLFWDFWDIHLKHWRMIRKSRGCTDIYGVFWRASLLIVSASWLGEKQKKCQLSLWSSYRNFKTIKSSFYLYLHSRNHPFKKIWVGWMWSQSFPNEKNKRSFLSSQPQAIWLSLNFSQWHNHYATGDRIW